MWWERSDVILWSVLSQITIYMSLLTTLPYLGSKFLWRAALMLRFNGTSGLRERSKFGIVAPEPNPSSSSSCCWDCKDYSIKSFSYIVQTCNSSQWTNSAIKEVAPLFTGSSFYRFCEENATYSMSCKSYFTILYFTMLIIRNQDHLSHKYIANKNCVIMIDIQVC